MARGFRGWEKRGIRDREDMNIPSNFFFKDCRQQQGLEMGSWGQSLRERKMKGGETEETARRIDMKGKGMVYVWLLW